MKIEKIYRLHITCPAKHTTYTDYKTKRAAVKNLEKMQDKTDWNATHIEEINTHKSKQYRSLTVLYVMSMDFNN